MIKTKKKRSFADHVYKTYNPSTEGYGSVSDWASTFNNVMGYDEAVIVMGSDNPLTILGLTKRPDSLDDLKSVYRKLVKIHHPDAGGDPKNAIKIIAAYSVIEDSFKGK